MTDLIGKCGDDLKVDEEQKAKEAGRAAPIDPYATAPPCERHASPNAVGVSQSKAGDDTLGNAGRTPIRSPTLPNFLASPQAHDEIGRIGGYRVLRLIGQGGMGMVFEGEDPQLKRRAAIKVMLPKFADDPDAKQRFLREAQTAAAIKHPHMVTIFQVGQDGGVPFLVMEFLQGESLEERLEREKTLEYSEVIRIGREMAEGMAAAHQEGLIHRDIKPANTWLEGKKGHVKILDFGLARFAEDGAHLTQDGAIIGTPAYMSPEQAQGHKLDARCDLWSLGVVLYRMSTGELPFLGSNSFSTLKAVEMHHPSPPAQMNASVPAGLSDLVMKLLEKDPSKRLALAQEVVEKLLQMETGPRSTLFARSRAELDGAGATAAHTAPSDTSLSQQQPKSQHWFLGFAACLILMGGSLAAWLAWGGKQESRDRTEERDKPTPVLTATAPGVTATEITLGMSAPFSGPAKEIGRGMQIGIETYFRHVNDTGGIHGRKLKLLALDDGYDPERCRTAMKDLIDQRPAFAFIGNVGTPTAEVALPMALEHKRVFFGAFTGTGLLRRDPPDRYVFNYRASYAEETAAIVQHLLTIRGIKPDEIAVFGQNDGYGAGGFSGVAKALRKNGFDSKRIVRVGYERNSLDLDAAVNGLLAHKAQIKAIVMVPTYRPAAAFIKRIVDGGMSPIFTSVSFVDSDALAESLKELGPKYSDGVIVTQVVPFFNSGASGVLEYRERLARYFPAEQPGFVSLEGYVTARAFCAGLEKAGPNLTADSFVDALQTIQGLDFGIGTRISFGPSEHQGSHKVWAAILDSQGRFRNLELD